MFCVRACLHISFLFFKKKESRGVLFNDIKRVGRTKRSGTNSSDGNNYEFILRGVNFVIRVNVEGGKKKFFLVQKVEYLMMFFVLISVCIDKFLVI